MLIPLYWAKSRDKPPGAGGQALAVSCWKWSNVSLADAQRQADERAVELSKILEAGTPPNQYGYSDRPLREEIIQTIAGDADKPAGVITRNAYGALVLNTSKAMFIDIDFEAVGQAARSINPFRRFLGGSPAPDPEKLALQKVEVWADHHRDLGLRVYRTFAGLRCLVMNRIFDATEPQTKEILQSIGSDPLYVRLCRAQECFRARLTPKPWRCRWHVPPSRYPWAGADEEASFRQWQIAYERAIAGYGVCRFVRHIGSNEMNREIQPILEIHDRMSCSQPERPLA